MEVIMKEKIVIAVLIARPIGAPISALHKILFFTHIR